MEDVLCGYVQIITVCLHDVKYAMLWGSEDFVERKTSSLGVAPFVFVLISVVGLFGSLAFSLKADKQVVSLWVVKTVAKMRTAASILMLHKKHGSSAVKSIKLMITGGWRVESTWIGGAVINSWSLTV